MPQAYYNEPPEAVTPKTGQVTQPETEEVESDLYSFDGYTVETNTKVVLIAKLNRPKHG